MTLGSCEDQARVGLDARLGEQPGWEVRSKLVAPRDGQRVEARDDHRPVERRGREPRDRRLNRLLAVGVEVRLARHVLDLDVGGGAAGEDVERFLQGRDPGRAAAGELDPEPADLFERHRPDEPAPVRRSRDVGVMHHHRDPVRRHADVEFHRLHAELDRRLEGFRRVLRDVRRVASVGHHDPLTERPFRHYRRPHAGRLAVPVEPHER